MTRIQHDCPICGTLKTIKVDKDGTLATMWDCLACGQGLAVKFKQEKLDPVRPEMEDKDKDVIRQVAAKTKKPHQKKSEKVDNAGL